MAQRPTFEDVQRDTDFSRAIVLTDTAGAPLDLGTTGDITAMVFRAKNDLDDPGAPEIVVNILGQQNDTDLANGRVLVGITSSELDVEVGDYQWQVQIQGGNEPGRYPLLPGIMQIVRIVE